MEDVLPTATSSARQPSTTVLIDPTNISLPESQQPTPQVPLPEIAHSDEPSAEIPAHSAIASAEPV
ncbi:hypothetical protein FRC11_001321, partial [Ceratobasidium sp. 423]